jgi:hypothetical protein
MQTEVYFICDEAPPPPHPPTPPPPLIVVIIDLLGRPSDETTNKRPCHTVSVA